MTERAMEGGVAGIGASAPALSFRFVRKPRGTNARTLHVLFRLGLITHRTVFSDRGKRLVLIALTPQGKDTIRRYYDECEGHVSAYADDSVSRTLSGPRIRDLQLIHEAPTYHGRGVHPEGQS